MTGAAPRVDRQVRDAYDKVAAKYADQFADELRHKPLDRALLRAFSEQVGALGERAEVPGEQAGTPGEPTAPIAAGLVVDIGCGPGHVTAHLAQLGLAAQGIDLSPAMIDIARSRYPGLDFAVGEVPGLPFGDGQLAGAVLFYSIIHLTAPQRAAAFAELARMLRPGGLMLVAFHIGDNEKLHVDNWFGEAVSFDGYVLSVQTVTDEITAAGLAADVIASRAPYPEVETARTRRGYVLARRAANNLPQST